MMNLSLIAQQLEQVIGAVDLGLDLALGDILIIGNNAMALLLSI